MKRLLVALSLLMDRQEFEWIVPAGVESGNGELRFSILAELGRVEDEAALLDAGRYVCEHKLTAKDAVPLIRRGRTGKGPEASVAGLVECLRRRLNGYLQTHRGATQAMAREALQILRLAVTDCEE